MKKNSYYLYLILMFSSIIGFGQVPNTTNKDYLGYVDAIKTYEKIANKGYKSVDLFQKLGDSYYFNARLKEANKWYEKLFSLNSKTLKPEYYYRYSQTLKANEEYTKADKYLEEFYSKSSSDSRGKVFSQQKNYLELIQKNSGRYDVEPTAINTQGYEYGGTIYKGKFIFSGSKDTLNLSTVKRRGVKKVFTDLYISIINNDWSLQTPSLLNKKNNNNFHEDSPVFTKDYKTVYFTKNNSDGTKLGLSANNAILLKIYKATIIDYKWTDVQELPFNSDNYSCAHPALSPDGKTLYFSSNMPGSTGQSDLYKVSISSNETYGKPIKLIGGVNTEGRETFPFVSDDNELYFSSDGQQGLGGLDIYVAKLDKQGMPTKIANVGIPVNSPMDDFAFIIESTSKKGFFSSNRDGGKGLDDIYNLTETREVDFGLAHTVVVTIKEADTNAPLDNATVSILDSKFNLIKHLDTDALGACKFIIDAGKKYYIRSEKPSFETKEAMLEIPEEEGLTELTIYNDRLVKGVKIGTDLAKTFGISLVYFDLNKADIRKDAALELEKILDVLNEYPKMKIDVRSHTDSRQTEEYNAILSEKRAKATIKWLINNGVKADRLTGKGYGETMLVNHCKDGVPCTDEEHQMNRRSEFIITAM